MPRITPCLWFDNQAEEAARFYTSVFPNSKITDTLRAGDGWPMPEGSIVTVDFELDGQPFVALNGGPEFNFTEAVSFQVDCHTQEEVDHYWSKLTEGGEESQCGWLKDRFGLSWQIVPRILIEMLKDQDPERATSVMNAMLPMKKLDIKKLEEAYGRVGSTA